MRLLGVTFDRHLSYSPHLRSTAVRAAQRIGFLRKAFTLLDHHGRTVAYKGFIRPVLEYCPLVWSGAAACHLERLDKVQKRALSLIGAGTIIDSLALRRTVSALCLLYKLLSSPRLTTLQPLLPAQLTPVDNPRTRHQLPESHSFRLSLDLPVRSNATIARSFPHGYARTWNSLPPSMLEDAPTLKGLQAFKIKVHKHLIRTNWLWATNLTQ